MISQNARERYLAGLARGLTEKEASDEAGHSRRAFHRLRDDPDFAARRDHAILEGTDVLEAEARRRAVEGVIYSESYDKDGNLVGQVRRYSDTLLIFLLKSRDPARFNRFEVTGSHGGPVKVEVSPDADSLARVASILADAGVLAARGEPDPSAH